MRDEEPNVFTAQYEQGRLVYQFRADGESVEEFVALLDHLVPEADVAVRLFRVSFDVDADVTADTDPADVESPEDYLHSIRVDAEAGRSEVDLAVRRAAAGELSGSADPVLDRFAETVVATEDMLP